MKDISRTVFVTPFDHTKYLIVRNEQQLDEIKRHFNIECDLSFLDAGSSAQVSTLQKDGVNLCIVQIEEDQSRPRVSVIALIAHESVHVWQHTRDSMGETNPSKEFEAYSIQRIFQDLLWSYENENGVDAEVTQKSTLWTQIKQTIGSIFKK